MARDRELRIEQIDARLAELDAEAKHRPLTDAECAEIENLVERMDKRRRRLAAQIEATRAKLRRLEQLKERLAA